MHSERQIRQEGASSDTAKKESPKEVEEAVSSVLSSMSGTDVDHEDMKGLVKQLRRDEEAQEAVQSITEGFVNKKVKYCPVTGKRYSPQIEKCPVHGVVLEWVEE